MTTKTIRPTYGASPVSQDFEDVFIMLLDEYFVRDHLKYYLDPTRCNEATLRVLARRFNALNYTERFGIPIARRLLGVDSTGLSYVFYVNKYKDKPAVFRYIGEPVGLTINAKAGRFTKDTNDPTDKSLWVFESQTNPSTFKPTGLDVYMSSGVPGQVVTSDQQAYVLETIPLVVPMMFQDVRITISSTNDFPLYAGGELILTKRIKL